MDIAYKEAQIYSLQSQLKDIKGPKKCKRVVVNPNTKFANIDSIKEAIPCAVEKGRLVSEPTR